MLFCTSPGKLASSGCFWMSWRHAITCENPEILLNVEGLYKALDVNLLGLVIESVSKSVEAFTHRKHRVLLEFIASRRRQWLLTKIRQLEVPFTWEMVGTDLDTAAITHFLRGDKPSFVIMGFRSNKDARDRVEVLRKTIAAPINITSSGEGKNSLVRLVKTGGAFHDEVGELLKYKAEIDRIDQVFAANGNAGNENLNTVNLSDDTTRLGTVTGVKRSRDEESSENKCS